jgi:hypothetical protein
MEITLEYICGNNALLAEEFIAVMANLARSFFTSNAQNTANQESDNDDINTNIDESDAEPSESQSSDICATIVNSPSTTEQGEYREAICTAGKSVRPWMGRKQYSSNRRGLRYNGFWAHAASWVSATYDKCFTRRSGCSIQSGNFQTGSLISRPDETT